MKKTEPKTKTKPETKNESKPETNEIDESKLTENEIDELNESYVEPKPETVNGNPVGIDNGQFPLSNEFENVEPDTVYTVSELSVILTDRYNRNINGKKIRSEFRKNVDNTFDGFRNPNEIYNGYRFTGSVITSIIIPYFDRLNSKRSDRIRNRKSGTVSDRKPISVISINGSGNIERSNGLPTETETGTDTE